VAPECFIALLSQLVKKRCRRQSAINFSSQHKNRFDSIQSKKNIEADKIIRRIACLFDGEEKKKQTDGKRERECKENVTYV
jgi:hypothetical protein